ncbi:MAG TPA: hypothetical protein VGM96_19425 [Reyranella sp.]|jgi:hypothetical protein
MLSKLLSMLLAVTLRALVFCFLVILWSASSPAQSIFTPLSDPGVSFGNHLPDGKDATFYRAWAQPVRDKPRDLGAGQWMLETDRKTDIAYPRLVALTNGASVARANAALEAMHGRILKTAYQANRRVTNTRFGELDTGLSFVVHFSLVKATYLSSSTLSLVAIGDEAHDGNGAYVLVRGATVDVAHGTIFTINSCHEERRRPFFTFGPLMTICDDQKLEAFRALWREQGRIVQATVPWQKTMNDSCRSIVLAYIDNASLFSLYLTEAGLAVHNAFAVGAWESGCVTDAHSPFFPVVIPWHKLTPLMNPGPLRDELLAQH